MLHDYGAFFSRHVCQSTVIIIIITTFFLHFVLNDAVAHGLRVPDLAWHVVPVDVGLLEEHVETPLVLRKRVTRNPRRGWGGVGWKEK